MRGLETSRRPLVWRIAAILGAIYALQVIAQDVDWLFSAAGVTAHGSYGFQGGPAFDQPTASGRVYSVDPGGPADRAGIRAGDVARSIETDGGVDTPRVGARWVLDLERGGASQRVTLTAEPSKALAQPGDPFGFGAATLSDLIAAALGLVILLRGGNRPTAVLVGVGLGAFGLMTAQAGPVFSHQPLRTLADVCNAINPVVQYVSFLAFGLTVLGGVDGGRRWRWALLATYAAAFGLMFVELDLNRYVYSLSVGTPDAVWRTSAWLQNHQLVSLMTMASLAGTTGLLAMAWARSTGEERRRIALLNLAFAGIIANQAWIVVVGTLHPMRLNEHLGEWNMLVADALAGVVAPALFAYAILRHRVIDLGFAVNRTLVYSIVSAIMLAAFGLIEWGVDHFVTIEGREKNAIIDAGIALGVYLTFHRVAGFVEHGVEALFFRRWQAKEAALRAAVAEAAFITRPAALLAASVGALGRFADGRACGLYLKGQDGYARVAGVGPEAIDADDPAMVRLRASLKPAEPGLAGSSLTAALAAPMVHRNELFGAAVFGETAAREPFRPDEIALLGWAVQQLGQDLHALKVEALEEKVVGLEGEAATLRGLIAGSLGVRPARGAAV